MASAKIIADNVAYYTVRCTCHGVDYDQTIVTEKTGKDLAAFIQAYADEMEAALPKPEDLPTEE